MRHLRSSRQELLPPVAEHSLTQRLCWCARPRFPGSSAVVRDRPQAVRTGLEPQQWDDRDRRAMAARGAARREECPYSRAAARQGRRPHCGDRCCTALRKLDHACDSAAGPTARLRKRERARVPCPRPIPYATGESRADVLDAGAASWLSPQHSSARQNQDHRRQSFAYQSRRPPVASDDSDLLLRVATKSQLGRGKQPIDDQHVTIGSVVDDLGIAVRTDDKQRRHFSLNDAG